MPTQTGAKIISGKARPPMLELALVTCLDGYDFPARRKAAVARHRSGSPRTEEESGASHRQSNPYPGL